MIAVIVAVVVVVVTILVLILALVRVSLGPVGKGATHWSHARSFVHGSF